MTSRLDCGDTKAREQEAGGQLDRFAGHVGAKTYGDLYGAGIFPTEELLEKMMYGAPRLHVNLDGLCKNISELPGIVQKGSKGLLYQPSPGMGNITNWEIWRIHQDPELIKCHRNRLLTN